MTYYYISECFKVGEYTYYLKSTKVPEKFINKPMFFESKEECINYYEKVGITVIE